MTLLFKIIRAAHANGTHHKLALDALRELQVPEAESWRKVFLKHAELFMEGSKAPDKDFKDFKNHVLHVGDNYWGGAPERVQNWYAMFVRELKAEKWSEAVYAAGVLSHYYTDPIQPFHTAQSEAESNIHRAVEWSISKSYDDLRKIGEASLWTQRPEPQEGAEWLADFVCQGAEKSNASYGHLIAHYDFKKGVVDPPAGLDDTARQIIAELMIYAVGGFAAILDRAIAEANVVPPQVHLTVDTVLAGLKIPMKWVLRKMTDAEDRREVEQMYDELMETGRVEENLSEDERTVRRLHAKEVLGARESERVKERAARVAGGVPVKDPVQRVGVQAAGVVSAQVPQQDGVVGAGAMAATAAAAQSILSAETAQAKPSCVEPAPVAAGEAASLDEAADKMRAALDRIGDKDDIDQVHSDNGQDARLDPGDDVVDAPSIGPKTAARLEKVDVHTVRQLLEADPGALAESLDVRHITARTIRDWQLQAQLVMDIPGINGTDSQMLVGAGFSTADKVREASAADLYAAVGEFAKSAEGQRILRFGKAPGRERIDRWVSLAASSSAAAA